MPEYPSSTERHEDAGSGQEAISPPQQGLINVGHAVSSGNDRIKGETNVRLEQAPQ